MKNDWSHVAHASPIIKNENSKSLIMEKKFSIVRTLPIKPLCLIVYAFPEGDNVFAIECITTITLEGCRYIQPMTIFFCLSRFISIQHDSSSSVESSRSCLLMSFNSFRTQSPTPPAEVFPKVLAGLFSHFFKRTRFLLRPQM